MKNLLFKALPLLTLAFISCDYILKPKAEKDVQDQQIKNIMLDQDKDADGCFKSAGYRWSVVKNDCIRVFELGMRLVPVNENIADIEDETDQAKFNAYLVIDSLKHRAEVFIASDTISSIVMEEGTKNVFISKNKAWKLKTENQYKLEHNGVLKYVSPQAIERNMIGSDVQEQ